MEHISSFGFCNAIFAVVVESLQDRDETGNFFAKKQKGEEIRIGRRFITQMDVSVAVLFDEKIGITRTFAVLECPLADNTRPLVDWDGLICDGTVAGSRGHRGSA